MMVRSVSKLIKNREEVSNFLLEKINEGEERFLKLRINNESELEQIRSNYNIWKSFNAEYLKTAFDDNQFFNEYKHSAISLEVITFRTPFWKIIESFKKEIKSNIEVLKEILYKMPLYEMHEMIPGGSMNFLAFCKDKVAVLKKDGSIHNDLSAQVTEKMILIPDILLCQLS